MTQAFIKLLIYNIEIHLPVFWPEARLHWLNLTIVFFVYIILTFPDLFFLSEASIEGHFKVI